MRNRITQIMAVLGLMAATLAAHAGRLPEFMNAEQLAAWRAQHAAPVVASAQAPDEQTSFFTGKPYDATSGTYLFKYRAYSPDLARWTSADPSGFPDGANNVLMVNNLIMTSCDPDGLLTWTGSLTYWGAGYIAGFVRMRVDLVSSTFNNGWWYDVSAGALFAGFMIGAVDAGAGTSPTTFLGANRPIDFEGHAFLAGAQAIIGTGIGFSTVVLGDASLSRDEQIMLPFQRETTGFDISEEVMAGASWVISSRLHKPLAE